MIIPRKYIVYYYTVAMELNKSTCLLVIDVIMIISNAYMLHLYERKFAVVHTMEKLWNIFKKKNVVFKCYYLRL